VGAGVDSHEVKEGGEREIGEEEEGQDVLPELPW
jgi:hypothetical protein